MLQRPSPALGAAVAFVLSATCLLSACQDAATRDDWTLASGPYLLITMVQTSDKPEPVSDTQKVMVTNRAGSVAIVNPEMPDYPIVGTLKGDEFKGHVDDAGGPVDLTGRLTADNRIAGELVGRSKNGKAALTGRFILAPAGESPPPTPSTSRCTRSGCLAPAGESPPPTP
jgi:hypothetical protein